MQIKRSIYVDIHNVGGSKIKNYLQNPQYLSELCEIADKVYVSRFYTIYYGIKALLFQEIHSYKE